MIDLTRNGLYTLTVILLLSMTSKISQAQSCGYSFSRALTIDHNQVAGFSPLFDFPVLVNITDPTFRTTANGGNVQNASGFDILFVDLSTGQQMAHQIEDYDATTGNLVAWVRVPVVYPTFNTELQVIYGNPNVTTNPSTPETWDEDYQAVWHLHDDFDDATVNGNDGTNNGSVDEAAFIADGQRFDGATDWISRTDATLNGNFPAESGGSPNEFTLSGWINVDVLNQRHPLLSKQGDGAGTDRGFVFMIEDDNRVKIEIFKNNVSGDRTEVFSTSTITAGTWNYISVSYRFVADGTSECSVYLNGVEEGSTTTAIGPIVANDRDLEIGRYFFNAGAQFWHDGLIDEVRISDVVRTEAWHATEYNNQNSPSGFYVLGPEVSSPVNPVVATCDFEFKKVITINNAQVAGATPHANFPVLINFTDADLATTANGGNVENANGWDIVFTDENFVHLDHDLEAYDPATGELVAWVNVPSLPTGTDYEINMLYGKASVFADPSTPCTWVDFDGVWHLHDDFLDATDNNEDGSNNGSTDNTNSQIADGQSFDGNDVIDLTSFPNKVTDFTMSGWIQTTDNTEPGQRIFCDDQTSGGYALSLGDGGTGRLRFFARGSNSVILDGSAGAIANNTWYYVAGVEDRVNQDRFIYINGVQNAANLNDGPNWSQDNGNASIGGETTGSAEAANRFEGLLDEIRVANVVRSASWLLTEYNNQFSPSTFYSVGSEEALAISSTQNGDWDQTTTWAGGQVPTAGSRVIVSHEVDLDDRNETICNLTVASSSSVTAQFRIQGGNRLKVIEDVILDAVGGGGNDVILRTDIGNDKLIVDGDMIVNHSNGNNVLIDVENAGDSIDIGGNLLLTHTGGVNIEFEVETPTSVFRVRGNSTFDLPDGEDDIITFDLNGGLFITDGTFSIARQNNFSDIIFDLDGGTFRCDSFYLSTMDGDGEDIVQLAIDQDSEFTVTRNMVFNMGGGDDHEIELNANAGTSGQFNVGGNLIFNKTGGDDINILVDDVNSVFSVAGKFIINSTGAEQMTINMDNGSLSVGDSFNINHLDGGQQFFIDMDGAATLNAATFNAVLDNNTNQEFLIDIDNTAQFNTTNDLILTIRDGNDFEFHLGENVIGSSGALNVGGNMILNHETAAGGDDIQFIISESSTATIGGALSMITDGASAAGNFFTQINDNGILSVDSNIVLTGANGNAEVVIDLNGNAILRIGGNFVRDAGPNNFGDVQGEVNTTIEYNGTRAQVFADEDGAGTDGIQYQNVIINNSFATEPQLTMEDDVTLTNAITFTDGVLQTTATELLTLADGITVNEGNANSYVTGPLRKVGDDPFVFPLGDEGRWARLAISDLQNGPLVTDQFTAEYNLDRLTDAFFDSTDYVGDPGGMHNTSIVEYWDLTRDNGAAEPRVTLHWENNGASFIDNTADLVVAHYVGGNTWVNEGGTFSGLLAAGSITSTTNISSFSPFTFGSTSESVNPLPIELINFSAKLQEQEVLLQWTTATEINNDYFTIEKSKNGVEFEFVVLVDGAGNSNRVIDYQTIDSNPFTGRSYYRLKQTDFDGTYSYSNTVMIEISSLERLYAYPNPSSDLFTFSVPVSGAIYDSKGKRIALLENAIQVSVKNYQPGVYYLKTNDGEAVKLMVK